MVLSRLSFFVASPALLVTVLGRADVTEVLSRNLVATAGGVVGLRACSYLVAGAGWSGTGPSRTP